MSTWPGPSPAEALAVALDQGPAAVGEDAFRLVVLVGSVGVVDDLLRLQVDAADVGALVAVGAEGQLALVGRAEVLASSVQRNGRSRLSSTSLRSASFGVPPS